VPPIFQPEVAAEAVWHAAHRRRRELTVGGSALAVIVGNTLLPWLGDRYLARTGYGSQQVRGMPVPDDRPDNLFNPVPELAATHGRFDSEAKTRSLQLALNQHARSMVVTAGGALAMGATLLTLRRLQRR